MSKKVGLKATAAAILAFASGAKKNALSDSEIVDGVQELMDQREAPPEGEPTEEEAAEPAPEETTAEDEETPAGEGDGEEEDDKEKTPAAKATARAIAITTSPEARGREALAAKLAANPKLTAKEAIALLAASGKSSRLAEVHDPKLGRGGNAARVSAAAKHAASLDPAAIYAARRGATARK